MYANAFCIDGVSVLMVGLFPVRQPARPMPILPFSLHPPATTAKVRSMLPVVKSNTLSTVQKYCNSASPRFQAESRSRQSKSQWYFIAHYSTRCILQGCAGLPGGITTGRLRRIMVQDEYTVRFIPGEHRIVHVSAPRYTTETQPKRLLTVITKYEPAYQTVPF
jgi:hypothetical protein